MHTPITKALIQSVRNDAARLVIESFLSVALAKKIDNALGKGPRLLDGFDPRKKQLWQTALYEFADALAGLREHLKTAARPNDTLLAWLETGQTALTAYGVTSVSRVIVALRVAERVLNVVDGQLWPPGGDTASWIATHQPQDLTPTDVNQIVRLAISIGRHGDFTAEAVEALGKGIGKETSGAEHLLNAFQEKPITTHSPEHKAFKTHPPVVVVASHGLAWMGDKPLPLSTPQRCAVIQALCDAYPGGLSKDQLWFKSNVPEAWKRLKDVYKSSDQWKQLIRLAGTPWKKYQLVWPETPELADPQLPHS